MKKELRMRTYVHQGIRGSFVSFSEYSSGYIFYVPSAKKTNSYLITIFDENFTSHLSMPELPYQGALR